MRIPRTQRRLIPTVDTCGHGDHVFVQRRRADGTLYAIPMTVNVCGRPAPITRTVNGNIEKRCTRHA